MTQTFVALDPIYFAYMGGCLGLLIVLEGVRQSIFGGDDSDKHRSRRLKLLAKGKTTEQILSQLRRPVKTSRWNQIPYFGNIPAKMRQAGMGMKPAHFLMACAGLSILVLAIASLKMALWIAALCAVLTGLVMPVSIINIIRKRRIEAFAKQLPDALDLMKRGLSVGHPLNVTISNVARNMPDPIGTEFGLMADQISYGETLTGAMNDLARRIDQEDMHYLAASVAIQHGSGGNLGNMLGTLAVVVRKRFAMRRKIKAVSSEGRISAWVLSSLPFVMYGATTLTAPDYYSSVSHEPLFKIMAVAVAVLVIGNGLLLRRLVTFRI